MIVTNDHHPTRYLLSHDDKDQRIDKWSCRSQLAWVESSRGRGHLRLAKGLAIKHPYTLSTCLASVAHETREIAACSTVFFCQVTWLVIIIVSVNFYHLGRFWLSSWRHFLGIVGGLIMPLAADFSQQSGWLKKTLARTQKPIISSLRLSRSQWVR